MKKYYLLFLLLEYQNKMVTEIINKIIQEINCIGREKLLSTSELPIGTSRQVL